MLDLRTYFKAPINSERNKLSRQFRHDFLRPVKLKMLAITFGKPTMTVHDGFTGITPYNYIVHTCSHIEKSHSCKHYSAFSIILSGGLLQAASIFLSRRFGDGRGRVIGSSGACSRG